MLDQFNRTINYLRISITDRCNLRCVYCMPESGIKLFPRKNILSYEEIVQITRVAVDLGINKVRITGGEPLVRRNVVGLVSMLAKIKGIDDLSMTTNGTLLEQFAQPLFEAGLHRINISLDTLNPQRYAQLTRGGDVNQVLAGIEATKAAGFTSIKLNCVIEKSSSEPDAVVVAEFAKKNNLPIRFIRQMNLLKGEFWAVESGSGGRCGQCNRLRLSSDGFLRPCLFNDLAYNVRELGIEQALRLAIEHKPHSGQVSRKNKFYSIGG